jgi:hypothetical protein
MPDNVRQCPTMSDNVRQCPTMSDNVWQCLTMSDNVRQCLTMSDNAWQCPAMPDKKYLTWPTLKKSILVNGPLGRQCPSNRVTKRPRKVPLWHSALSFGRATVPNLVTHYSFQKGPPPFLSCIQEKHPSLSLSLSLCYFSRVLHSLTHSHAVTILSYGLLFFRLIRMHHFAPIPALKLKFTHALYCSQLKSNIVYLIWQLSK